MTPPVGGTVPPLRLRLPYGRSLERGGSARREDPLLLVLVPLAFSPICSGELRALSAARDALAPARVVVASCDHEASLEAWRTAEDAVVEVASDFWPHGEVSRALGAFDAEAGLPRRVSVLLDADGVVRWTDESAPGHPRDVARAIAAVAALTR